MAFLALDTSNYTSSVALADGGRLLADKRKLLSVKKDAVGLRQSEALFQHWTNLPVLVNEAFEIARSENVTVEAVIASDKPRPQEGSYMPVFGAGVSAAKMLGSALGVPVIFRSHQEGHILAASYGNNIDFKSELVCAHLSGGTLELVKIENGVITIIGGTKDISYGQLIDRLGVRLGFAFPAGREIDAMACSFDNSGYKSSFKPIYTKGCQLNISGLETQLVRALDQGLMEKDEMAYCIMKAVADSFIKIVKSTGCRQVLVSGGVASSTFLRNACASEGYIFGRPQLCSDNACGLALSGGKLPW